MNPEFVFRNSAELLAAGKSTQAAQGFRQLLAVYPEHQPSLNNLGAALFLAGDIAGALATFQQLADAASSAALTHYNLGRCHRELADDAAAETAYRRAIALQPDYPEALENLANLLADRNRHRDALPLYRHLLTLRPGAASAYRQIANLLRDMGQLDEALAALSEGIAQVSPDDRDALSVLQCLLVSPMPGSAEEISEQRAALADGISTLLARPMAVADPVRDIGTVPFFLAYHGEDDRALNRGLADLFRHACPTLIVSAGKGRPIRPQPRIGVVTAHAGQHTTARFFDRSLAKLAEHADLHYFYAGREWRGQLAAGGQPPPTPHTALPEALGAAQKVLADAALDTLIYPEIGIHPLPYFLAHARLAPVQIALYGQPVTTGLPTIDYFLSHAGSEPPDATQHYRERLLLLPREVTYACIDQRPVGSSGRSRRDLGLPEKGALYLCAQSLFKIHPDFDRSLRAILDQDPAAHLVLIATRGYWGDAMLRRLQKKLGNAASRVVMLPYLPLPDFLALVECCDVALDTHQFSGGGTTFDTLQMGTPLVTWLGRFMRARQTAALYEAMGIDELTVASEADYVALALDLAHDPARRAKLRSEILARKHRIFNDTGSAQAFVELILGARPVADG